MWQFLNVNEQITIIQFVQGVLGVAPKFYRYKVVDKVEISKCNNTFFEFVKAPLQFSLDYTVIKVISEFTSMYYIYCHLCFMFRKKICFFLMHNTFPTK